MGGHNNVANADPSQMGDAARASSSLAFLRSREDKGNLADGNGGPNGHFRFYDNRQSYNLFVQNTGEKTSIAQRIIQELSRITSVGKCLRIFDAGVGDGSVLTEVMEGMHQLFPRKKHLVVGKEISTEDVRAVLPKIAQRLAEHPDAVWVLTNRPYDQAPELSAGSEAVRKKLVWHEAKLEGTNTHALKESIRKLQSFVDENWKTKPSADGEYVIAEKPVVLVIYRKDRKRALRRVIPNKNKPKAAYHGIIASQPYALKAELGFKAGKVIAPLARALATGGVLLGFHSKGGDPAHEIYNGVWSGNPFQHSGQDILDGVKQVMPEKERRKYEFHTRDDLSYPLYRLGDNAANIGTSPLLSLWAIATYIAQVKDSRIKAAVTNGKFLDAVERVYKKYNGNLWFHDDAYAITRRAEQRPLGNVRAAIGAAYQWLRQKPHAPVAG